MMNNVTIFGRLTAKPELRETPDGTKVTSVGYKDGCKFFIGERIAGKKLSEAQIKTLCEKGETKKIEGLISKTGKKFDAILKVGNDGKIEFKFD